MSRRGGDDEAGDEEGGARRLDRWLWYVRLYKTRPLAAEAVGAGHVQLHGVRAKASRPVRVGDQLSVARDGLRRDLEVRALPVRRGPASEALACYVESPESLARNLIAAEAHRIAALSTARPDARPDKKARRDLLAFARRQGRR